MNTCAKCNGILNLYSAPKHCWYRTLNNLDGVTHYFCLFCLFHQSSMGNDFNHVLVCPICLQEVFEFFNLKTSNVVTFNEMAMEYGCFLTCDEMCPLQSNNDDVISKLNDKIKSFASSYIRFNLPGTLKMKLDHVLNTKRRFVHQPASYALFCNLQTM